MCDGLSLTNTELAHFRCDVSGVAGVLTFRNESGVLLVAIFTSNCICCFYFRLLLSHLVSTWDSLSKVCLSQN